MKNKINFLKDKSRDIRIDTLKMVALAHSSHVGSTLSCVDILTTLYFDTLKISPKNPNKLNRDKFILSKGHAGVGLLSTLAHRGFFPKDNLKDFFKNNSYLTGHTMIESAPGVEATTGSLGHGLPIGIGMAIAAKKDNIKSRVFVLLSDGEMDEGSNWEAILSAAHFQLDNLVVIIDYNKIQGFGFVKEVMNLEPLQGKLESFSWQVKQINGHDFASLINTLKNVPFQKNKPSCIIANTVKGKGVSFMENRLEWHYKSPNKEELKIALTKLK